MVISLEDTRLPADPINTMEYAEYFCHASRTSNNYHKSQPITKVISLKDEFPAEFIEFRKTGKLRFETKLNDFRKFEFPCIFNVRIKKRI